MHYAGVCMYPSMHWVGGVSQHALAPLEQRWEVWQIPPTRTRGRHPPVDTTGYGQQAGGMHPTGMHSCSLCKYIILIDIGKFPVFYPVWKNEDPNSLCHGSPEILH